MLVIEDEKDVALSVMKRLKYAGFDVSVAGDGVAATAAAFQFQPDVVILDIGLPCGDGFEVANRLRENVVTAITPIIFLTARTSELDRQKAESLGAFAYMTKPFKSEELVSTIEEALGS
ncbi:MAG: response regulator [Fimbriimonas ginsengisoli]|uniref:Response regulator n=1 Tax=Fimbriimonas ginsengisoli TaxID=1005039 RepID=A0A931PTK6_FIMGI|nr:response regulator [Fimbriimonas ginsengisoli]